VLNALFERHFFYLKGEVLKGKSTTFEETKATATSDER
jgi:hypothetical protein